jgi:hypothetical protein
MSSRRQLVSRGERALVEASPAQRPRHRESEARATGQHTTLPPYEPPTCPLTTSGKRALDELRLNHDYSRYKKHLDTAILNVTNCTAESNDRLHTRKKQAKSYAEKRQQASSQSEEKKEAEEAALERARDLEKKVGNLTTKAEKALRDLIDYGDELAQQEDILKSVGEYIAAAPAPTPRAAGRQRQRRLRDEDDDEDEDYANKNMNVGEEEQGPASDPSILSPFELLKNAKDEYASSYSSKSMKTRQGYYFYSRM